MKTFALASLVALLAAALPAPSADAGHRHGFRHYHGYHFGYFGHHRHCEWRRYWRHGRWHWFRHCH